MTKRIAIEDYIHQHQPLPLIDVRAPLEFEEGHIPKAYSMPLFSDEERAVIGTTYKQQGREEAILKGFDFTGKKWRGFIENALKIAPEKKIAVHCWRGGMRSGAMAWALDFYGFEVFLIEGGYKRFRNWALEQFERDYHLRVLGGMTGSHKTEILHALKARGKQMIDLEGLAQHQGSAFGSMNKMTQPSQQQFENELALQLAGMNNKATIWIEDESHLVGKRIVPNALYDQMRTADLIKLEIPKNQRVDFLAREYGRLDKVFLKERTRRIGKRLGPQNTKKALEAIQNDRMRDFIRTVLSYYDKTYNRGITKRDPKKVFPLKMDFDHPAGAALEILNYSETYA